jgi:hypothetical protein
MPELGSGLSLPTGTPVLIPIHSIGVRLRAHPGFRNQGEEPLYSILSIGEATFMRVLVQANDSEEGRSQGAKILRRAKAFATGLSIITVGQVWVEPVLLDPNLRMIWEEPRRLQLIQDKEIDPAGPHDLEDYEVATSTQLVGWIFAQYPQVSVFHNSGLFLLRSSLAYDFADYYYAEAVVAFYRIVEAVVARRLGITKPDLKDVLQEAKALGLLDEPGQPETTGWSADEITDIYVVRSGPSAHGAELAVVTREMAVEAKLFADAMLIKDYLNRRGGPIDVGGPVRRWRGRRKPEAQAPRE